MDRNAPAAPGKEHVGLFQQNRTRSSGTESAQTASPGSWTFTLSGRHGGATESMDSELTELGLMQKGQWSSRRPCRTTCMATDWLKTLERVSQRFHRYYQLGRWNDSTGIVSGANAAFSVSGSHIYTAAGQNSVIVGAPIRQAA